MNTHYVVQVDYEIFGAGTSERNAYEDAVEWADDLPAFEKMPRFIGTSLSCDRAVTKNMTQHGEMHVGEMVIITRAEAESMGYNVAAHD